MTDLTKENSSVIKIMEKAWGFECEKFNKGQNVLNLIGFQVSEEYRGLSPLWGKERICFRSLSILQCNTVELLNNIGV